MVFTEPAPLRFSDLNKNGVLSYEGIFRAFETVSVHHSASLGIDMVDNTRNGYAWIITNWHVKVRRLPAFREFPSITARTWTYTKKPGASTNRYYQLVDADGSPIAEGHAVFCMMDIHTGRLRRFTQELIDLYSPEPEENCLFGETRMKNLYPLDPAEYDLTVPVKVRRTDVDFNLHVHNIEYLNYACEALTRDDFDGDVLTDLRISYVAQVFETDELTICRRLTETEDGNVYRIDLRSNGEPACLMELK